MNEDLELAVRAIRAAGEVISQRFGGHHAVRHKGPGQPVTEADEAADRLLRDRLLGERPEYGWVSEESAGSPERPAASRVWVIDPLDGTSSFIAGVPDFAVSVALLDVGGDVLLGVIFNPLSGLLLHAVRAGGAFRGDRRLHVKRRAAPGGTLLVSRGDLEHGVFAGLEPRWCLKPLGSTTCKMAGVAAGSAHAYLSAGPKAEWDVAAASLIVREAGGQVTDIRGELFRFRGARTPFSGVIASNGDAHLALASWARDNLFASV